MKKLLAVVVFCLPAFGQAAYSGSTLYQGAVAYGAAACGPPYYSCFVAPLTYSARTDTCETGLESGCSGLGLSFLGCNTWANGTYTPVNTTAGGCPVTNGGTAPNIGGLYGAGNIITEPSFNSRVVRATDYSTTSASCLGTVYQIGTAGGSWWAADASKFTVQPQNGVQCVFAFSANSALGVAVTSIGGQSGAACTDNCQAFVTGASTTWSHINPSLLWEIINGRINQLTICDATYLAGSYPSSCVPPTFAHASTWVFHRAPVFTFLTGCSGGPCGLPSDFVPNWTGTVGVSDDDTSITLVLSDDGQDTPQNSAGAAIDCFVNQPPSPISGSSNYGPIFVVNWTLGTASTVAKGLSIGTNGWRVFNTCGLSGAGAIGPNITGNWGDTGAPTDGTCSGGGCTSEVPAQQSVGTSGGSDILDHVWMHETSSRPNSIYAGLGSAGTNPTLSTTGTCTSGSAILTQPATPPNPFLAAWVGLSISASGCGPAGAKLSTTILSWQSATQVTLATSASTTVTGTATIILTPPGSCSGTFCGDSNMFWEIATTNNRACAALGCEGHSITGYLNEYVGHNYSAYNYHNYNATTALERLLANPLPVDDHGTYHNGNSIDQQPGFSGSGNVCDQTGTPGGVPTGSFVCPPYYIAA